MATSSPPSNAIVSWALPPNAHSSDGPLSNSLRFMEAISQQGIAFAPSMPEAEAIQAAAQKAGISTKQALTAYLAILNYE